MLHETPHDYYRFTKYALRKLANDTGFNILILKETGGIIEVLADLTCKTLLYIPFIGSYLSKFIQSLIFIFTKSKIGKKISSKTSSTFPLGYFLIAEKL